MVRYKIRREEIRNLETIHSVMAQYIESLKQAIETFTMWKQDQRSAWRLIVEDLKNYQVVRDDLASVKVLVPLTVDQVATIFLAAGYVNIKEEESYVSAFDRARRAVNKILDRAPADESGEEPAVPSADEQNVQERLIPKTPEVPRGEPAPEGGTPAPPVQADGTTAAKQSFKGFLKKEPVPMTKAYQRGASQRGSKKSLLWDGLRGACMATLLDMPMKDTPKLEAAMLRRLSVDASVDPRSLLRVLAGKPVRGDAGYRARRVLEAAGLLPKDSQKGT